MTNRKFYKTIVQVEILSEDPVINVNLNTIADQIIEGDWSGNVTIKSAEVLNGKQMARALKNQGSDPGFFKLSHDGEDADK